METSQACVAFAALGHETRLAVFRALVATDAGLTAGALAQALEVRPSTLSAHLAVLERAGLVTQRRDGRFLHYALDRDGLGALLTWLVRDCCGGRPALCLPASCGC